jgi:YVTN family beta-propeller protein
MKTVIRINSCLRANYRFTSVLLSVGILSFAAVPVRALPKDTVITTISTGNVYVGDVVVSPDGTYLYGANNDNKTVMVISTATNEVTQTIAVGNLPFGVAVSPDGSTLYVSNADDGTVSVIDTGTDTQWRWATIRRIWP